MAVFTDLDGVTPGMEHLFVCRCRVTSFLCLYFSSNIGLGGNEEDGYVGR